jgi:methionyl-tRNA synthetase
MNHILVGNAWVYANGSLHLGHVASLLPGDVIARYHRAIGDDVYFVSGSDCHGTPVSIRARQENKTPDEVCEAYHQEFSECFQKLGFSYDCYTKTADDHHKNFVKEFHKKLYQSPYVYETEIPQAYCSHCRTFLADRYVTGKCPSCGADTRGDQCDQCGAVLETQELIEPICATCGHQVIFKPTKHLYIAISKLKEELEAYVEEHEKKGDWRKNGIAITKKYLQEGLRDRALTRDLDWGIDVPYPGYEDKKIYIWAENVLGYLSASCKAAKERGLGQSEINELWGENAIHYYVHGKDNVPFHTIILPSLLIANNQGWHLPDRIISGEYLTIEGRKISTSQNYAIWVKDIIDRYQPDAIRYYLLAYGPEKRDADFSWKEFVQCNNSDLVGAYGNLINRSLAFIEKYFSGKVPEGTLDSEILSQINPLYFQVGTLIQKGEIKEAIREIFELVRFGNRYFDREKPWITRTENEAACRNTLFNCVQIIVNLGVLLEPFLPFSSKVVCNWFKQDTSWKRHHVKSGYQLPEITVLFQRLDAKIVDEELQKLNHSQL